MKVAITTSGNTLDSKLDLRFGRAHSFIVVDTESGGHEVIANEENVKALQGAGVQAAKNVADTGVEAVITGHVGPKAFATLQAGKIDIYNGASGTVANAIEQFNAGKLQKAQTADVEGHWM